MLSLNTETDFRATVWIWQFIKYYIILYYNHCKLKKKIVVEERTTTTCPLYIICEQ